MKFKKQWLGSTIIAGPLVFFSFGCTEEPVRLPNIVFILSDDIGQGDIAVYHRERTGQKEVIPTPNIDRLAEEGIRFRDAYAPAALCAPTRYSIMTGRNTYRSYAPWGVWSSFSPSPVEEGQQTVGDIMKNAGYHTAFFGKSHLGGRFNKLEPGNGYPGSELWDDGWDYSRFIDDYPNTFGFDYSFQSPQGIQNVPYCFYENGVWEPLSEESIIKIMKNPRKKSEPNIRHEYIKGDSEWKTSIVGAKLTQKTIEFIDDHLKRQPDNPFFIYYCTQAVHSPWEPPVEFYGTTVKGTTASNHGDMIYELDLQVGKIVEALKQANVYENTLIIFTSDNGGMNIKETNVNGHHSCNGFRASKGSHYEGGVKIPFIASWPGIIPKGKVTDEPIGAHDLMATLYALTGQDMPEDQAMDSYNILPLLKDEPSAKGRERMYYSGSLNSNPEGPMLIYRNGYWKLIINSDRECAAGTPFALFNLKDNPYEDESMNLINDPAQKDRIEEMHKHFTYIITTRERTTELVTSNKDFKVEPR